MHWNHPDYSEVIGAFSDRAKAEEYCRLPGASEFTVEDIVLDELLPELETKIKPPNTEIGLQQN